MDSDRSVPLRFLGSLLLGSLLFFLSSCTTSPADLRPFTSDACTAFPEGPREDRSRWADCCLQHDIAATA